MTIDAIPTAKPIPLVINAPSAFVAGVYGRRAPFLEEAAKRVYDVANSLTIYIQSQSPGADKESNWLPAPETGGFKLALRLYVPKKPVADGTWKPPAVQRVGS
jgi:hypothetical protein